MGVLNSSAVLRFLSAALGSALRARATRCLLACLAVLGGSLASAASEQTTTTPAGLRAQSSAIVDADGTGTPELLRERFLAGDGRPVVPGDAIVVPAGSALWFQIRLPPVNAPTQWVLTVPQPGIDRAELFRWSPDAGAAALTVQRAGDAIPVAAWPMRHLYPAFELTALPGDDVRVYLRVEHGSTVGVRWVLREARDAHAHSQGWHMALAFYAGLVLTIALFSGLQMLLGRGHLHGWFMLYVLIVALAQASMTGLGGEYLWPNQAWWNDRAPVVLGVLGLAMLHLLLRQMVVDRDMRWIPGSLVVMAAAGCALVAGFIATDRETLFPLVVPYIVFSLAVQLWVAGWYARRLPRPGLCVLAAVACLAAGAMFPVLRLLNVVQVSLATQYGAQIGSALELSLLLLALHFHSSGFRDNQRRVGSLDRVDPLTGLGNHRMLVRRLDQLLMRRARDPAAGTILRIRLGNAIDIRQEFGLDVAQTAVVHAGACISSVVQEGDTVARHKDGDFVVLLNGHLSRSQLTDMGQRLIVQGLAPNTQLPAHTVLQLKVAVAEAPFGNQGAATILHTLGSVLDDLNGRSGTALRFVTDNGGWRGSRGNVPA